MQRSTDHPESGHAAGADFEDRLRGLILNNGVPNALKPAPTTHESIAHIGTQEFIPPHLRSASITEQQEYLRRRQKQVNDTKPTAVKTNSRPVQAQHKVGATERLDFDSPTVTNSQDSQNKTQQSLQTTRGRPSTPAPRTTQQVADTVPSTLGRPLSGIVTSSTALKSEVGFDQPQKLRPQNTKVFISPKTAQSLPHENPHTHPRASQSSSASVNRQLSNQNYVIPHNSPSQGQKRFQSHQNGNSQRTNGQQSFLSSRNTHTAFADPHNTIKQTANFARPPITPNKQLYNPNGQHLDTPSQLHITVPVPMRTSYLESLAASEIPKAEIPPNELQEKEALRVILHELCRQTVSAYESAENASFDPQSVALKCFGSLSSGYATHGSDMDLILVSPNSMPDTASPESEIPRLLEKVLLDRGYGARLLNRTRVPIIKVCEKPTPELFQALKDNRKKWEEERDLPPKPKRRQKDFNARSQTQARKQNDLIAENVETRSAAPSENAEAIIVVSLPFEKKGRVYDRISQKESPQEVEVDTRSTGPVESPSAAVIVRLPDAGFCQRQLQLSIKGNPQASAHKAGTAGRSTHSEQQNDVGKHNINRPMKNTSHDRNSLLTDARPQNPPIERTDEELVRLYGLAMKEGWFNDEERAIIHRFVNIVKQRKGREPGDLEKSRTALKNLPDVLSRYRERPQDLHLDFPKDGVGVQCDINFSNFLALHNTLLLRCYSHCDPRIRQMVIFVKAWAKKRKINSPYHGTLSSYGYVLMVLHYIVNVANPPLAPNLQMAWKAAPKEKLEENEYNGCDIRFWRSEREIRIAANRGQLTTNRQSLGSLLRGFFQYFAHESTEFLRDRQFLGHGFSWSYNVLSLRTYGGLLTKKEKGWTGARTETIEPTAIGQEAKEVKHRYLFAIEDPFEIDHNVARPVAHHGIVAIRSEFRRAHKLILNAGFSNGVAVDLFEEGKEHVQERLFFGPNPARFNIHRKSAPPKVGGDTNGNLPDRQGDKTFKVVPPPAGDMVMHSLANRDTVTTLGKIEEVDRVVEQAAAAAREQDDDISPGSPIILDEDMRG
ncbi:Zinc finger, CCHC domain-containing protein [Xylographa opegraphella]|nr:Zinc finger, CCHC domain-containing protein [Xylographa opegraphella]